MTRTALLFVACACVCAGCFTSGGSCRISVANESRRAVTDVVVEAGGEFAYSAATIAPHAVGSYRDLPNGLKGPLKAKWRGEDGNEKSKTIGVADGVPGSFRGRILVQIDKTGEVKVFVMPDSQDGESVIPWGFSDKVDGTLNIPGFSQE